MIIMRYAIDDFTALQVCTVMDDCGIRIVSVVGDRVGYHIIGQDEQIDYSAVDKAIADQDSAG